MAARRDRQPVAKMEMISYDGVQQSNAREKEEKRLSTLFQDAGALPPPYSLDLLNHCAEFSSVLPQCIATMVTNCDEFGHRLTPIIDLTKEDADAAIANAIYLERIDEAQGTDNAEEPSEADIQARRAEIEVGMRKERAWLEMFFNYASDDCSFVELRSRLHTDKEANGNGYLEAMRNSFGKVAKLRHVPSATIRPMPKGKWMQVDVKVRVSPIKLKTIKGWRQFRRYIQICEGRTVYFKEFGDPRVMSAETGRYFEDGKDRAANLDAMKRDEPTAREATELWSDCFYNPSGPYGLPRWIGNLLSVLGSHQAENVNFMFFDNNSIPPLVVMVEGGRLSGDAKTMLKKVLENRRGSINFHKGIILEAAASDSSGSSIADGKVRIRIQPLTDHILKDGIFMAYDEANRNKIGESFRLPKLLRGDSSDVNRATADAALAFAEQQVFSGTRNRFDWLMDRTLLTDLDVLYHEYESIGPDLKDAAGLTTAVQAFSGSLKVNEFRQIAGEIFGRKFDPVPEDWGNMPPALNTGGGAGGGFGFMAGPAGAEKDANGADPVAMARNLISLRKAVREAEGDEAVREFKADKEGAEREGEQVIHLSSRDMRRLVKQGKRTE